MDVNTEMHDCEPAMTRPQHLNMSYSLSSSIHGQITRHFGLLELSALFATPPPPTRLPPPPPSFLISAQWMTLALLTMRGLIF